MLCAMLAGCQTGSTTAASFCAVNEPVRYTAAERAAVTPAQQRRDLQHNQYGAQVCGWRP
jgi:hypothetical protein